MLEHPPRILRIDREVGPMIERFWARVLQQNDAWPMFVPTSWWRSQEQNARVNGDPYSQHLLGLALDEDSPEHRDLFEPFAASARALGLIAVVEHDHVHLQAYTLDRNPLRLSARLRELSGVRAFA